jgi:hypothetical protein
MALDTDIDDQDQSETFDEEITGGDADLETSYPLDREVRDFTHARGDDDVDEDDDARDADEEDDELLGDLDDDEEEDDLDDDDADDDPLASDDIQDFTADAHFAPEEGEEEVSAHGDGEAEVSSMGDMTQYDAASRASDFESEDLSDADLEELDYAPARASGEGEKEDRVQTEGGEAPDADKAADDAATDVDPAPGAPTVRHEDKRLDEGLEETFPASDPVSAKHIT